MKKIVSIIYMFAFPVLVFGADVTDANTLFTKIESLLKMILPIIIAIAVVWFVYNVFAYMIADDEDKKKNAKSKMIYGIIGLFVMVSVWGLVDILKGTFNLGTSTPKTPLLPPL